MFRSLGWYMFRSFPIDVPSRPLVWLWITGAETIVCKFVQRGSDRLVNGVFVALTRWTTLLRKGTTARALDFATVTLVSLRRSAIRGMRRYF
jgi:hypothetical protein